MVQRSQVQILSSRLFKLFLSNDLRLTIGDTFLVKSLVIPSVIPLVIPLGRRMVAGRPRNDHSAQAAKTSPQGPHSILTALRSATFFLMLKFDVPDPNSRLR